MKQSRWSAVGVLVVAGVLVAACGDSKSGGGAASVSERERPYVDAIAASIRSDETFPGGGDNADCLAAGIVDILGVENLEKAGLSPDELTAGDSLNLEAIGEKRVDELVTFILDGDCVDMAAVIAESISSEAGGKISDKQASCVADKVVDQPGFRDVMKGSFAGTADESEMLGAVGDIFGYLSECGVSITDLSS